CHRSTTDARPHTHDPPYLHDPLPTSKLPRAAVTELMSNVSRLNRTMRVGRAANSAAEESSPGSGGSLKARCPVIPTPPKQTSTTDRKSTRMNYSTQIMSYDGFCLQIT